MPVFNSVPVLVTGTVGTTAVRIDTSPRSDRQAVNIVNNGTGDAFFFGASNVNTTNGIRIDQNGGVWDWPCGPSCNLYLVASTTMTYCLYEWGP